MSARRRRGWILTDELAVLPYSQASDGDQLAFRRVPIDQSIAFNVAA